MKAQDLLARGERLLVAHRGWPTAGAPEGTVPACERAVAAGAPVVEIDVQPTADGFLAVHHDATLERLTGDARNVWEVSAAELAGIPMRGAPGVRIPLLDEVLAALAGRAVLDIELKTDAGLPPRRMSELLFGALARAGSPHDVMVTSFDLELLKEVRFHAPTLVAGWIVGDPEQAGRAAVEGLQAGVSLLVTRDSLADEGFLARAGEHALPVWVYGVATAAEAQAHWDRGCRAVVVDSLAAPPSAPSHQVPPVQVQVAGESRTGRTVLALDVGTRIVRAAVLDPASGVLVQAQRVFEATVGEDGSREHDGEWAVECVQDLIHELAEVHPEPPAAAALACQRGSALWVDPSSLAPRTPVASWHDSRGASLAEGLGGDLEELERTAALPFFGGWSAPLAVVLQREYSPGDDALLLPLASFLAARLGGAPARVESTSANRTFLLDARTLEWSSRLGEAFGLSVDQLPPLTTTIADHGAIPWGAAAVPLRVVVGDQQAAYVGVSGPTGNRLVVNLGSQAFVMKAWRAPMRVPNGCWRGPLWTSPARPRPKTFLIELPVGLPTVGGELPADVGRGRAEIARRIALAASTLIPFGTQIAAQCNQVTTQEDRTIVLGGGLTAAPQLCKLVAEALPLEGVRAWMPDLTLLGAARLGAAAATLPWQIESGGGLSPVQPVS